VFIPVIETNKMYISNNIQKLLHKKANVFYQNESKNAQKFKIITPSFDELTQIKMPFSKKIKIILIAFSIFSLYFTKIFRNTSKKKEIKKNKTVLIYSFTKNQVFQDNSLYQIYNFLTSKKFDITKENEILIECREIWRTKQYSNLTVTLDIPLRIFSLTFSLKLQIKLLIIFLRRLIVLIKSFNDSQYMYLIFKEYIFDENVYLSIVNKNQVDRIITGPGNYKYQPIIFEMSEFIVERVMLWYSSNSVPLMYKSKKVENNARHWEIFLKHMAIDTHWVWTNEHKRYLKKMTNSAILVKGSMVFYNPPKKLDSNKKYDVVIFDVTPQNSKSVFKDTIFSFPIAKEFIEDIIESVELVSQKLDKNIDIYIKHKRNFAPTHSSEYIAYIDVLAKNRQLFVLPLDSDLYETIATSKIVIGFPFTSPVIIGQELKVPSIYYSSTNALAKYNQASFIQSKLELRKYIETNLGK
jgi:polysaccharide biosynthesis PFTS motif protein